MRPRLEAVLDAVEKGVVIQAGNTITASAAALRVLAVDGSCRARRRTLRGPGRPPT